MIKKLKVLLLSTVVAVGTWGCAKNENISTNFFIKLLFITDL